MIAGVVFCPATPLLLRELTGLEDVAADLRSRCVETLASALESVAEAAGQPGEVVVIAGGELTGELPPGAPDAVHRYARGIDRSRGSAPPRDAPVPLGTTIARRLLADAGWGGPVRLLAVREDETPAVCRALGESLTEGAAQVVLVVMGDGSARRDLKAPGYLDDRAKGYDDAVATALGGPDVEALLGLDFGLAARLLVTGRAPWQVAAAAVRRGGVDGWVGSVVHREAPLGVEYLLATWLPGGPDSW
ncbi:hypothetical protein [Janibacter sp. G1551]|uniref:hypothetical protein n=1 Tax=Janibacter sp. G1551 TaxID=3420440 RepID=UPI003D029263